MRCGPELLPGGGVRFELWAPAAEAVALVLDSPRPAALPMRRTADGWHRLTVEDAGPGTRYRFRLPDGLLVPDPASHRNPDGPHGPSEVVDPGRYRWRDAGWRGRPWHEAVLYELHVGCFTPEGSYAAAAARLPELAALGITAVELMPLAQAQGARGWGYDGVLPFASAAAYGSPDELRAFVDRAHELGLMVLLDVVYNHFGPDGNYLHAYCPTFFDADQPTPWGPAIRFEGEGSTPVRAFFIANALYWVEQFHLDGLRLDAVHQIRDASPVPIVEEIAHALARGPGSRRHVHLVLENDANQAHRLVRDGQDRPLAATAQWNDDLHHAAHVLLTGETDGYYADYAVQPVQLLGRALAEGYVFQGQLSQHSGAARGEPSGHLPPTAFVSFLQNHDQAGNRALGERLSALAAAPRLDALYTCLLLSPHIPMLFMGEEFAASAPFLYFCDFDGALAQAVSEGRRNEFRHFAAFVDPAARARIPDPNAASTCAHSTLAWDERDASPHRERLALVRGLLALRREHLVPRLAGPMQGGRSLGQGERLHVQWSLADGTLWEIVAQLGDAPRALQAAPGARVVHASHVQPSGWSVLVTHGS